MITIANPIYDVVFKFLMDDARIARTILSALLKKDIVSVEMRPHEYVNQKVEGIAVQRIDFGAVVRENGEEKLILVELQMGGGQRLPSVSGGYPWLDTELLRFRQYMARQYNDPKNMTIGPKQQYALPMVMVYLLGHKVGDIEEPVVYVRHDVYDYNDQVVTRGIPDPFVDSLTHESIIVQIPRLRGQVNTRLDQVLSVFDQSRQDQGNSKLLNIDDSLYDPDDAEMQRILLRLTGAAADDEFRRQMNLEDEIFMEIKNRDAEILQRDYAIAHQKEQLEQKDAQLEQKDAQLRKSIALLRQANLSSKAIADSLGIDIAEIDK